MSGASTKTKTRSKREKWGMREAARALGVNHGHLSRVVRGLRESASLLAQYKELVITKKPTMNTSRLPIPLTESGAPANKCFDAADNNRVHEYAAETLAPLGFAIVAVQLKPDWSNPDEAEMGTSIGDELNNAELGHCDSTSWQPKLRHFFYVDASRLADALNFIKSALERRGALSRAIVSSYDVSCKVWRAFHPELT